MAERKIENVTPKDFIPLYGYFRYINQVDKSEPSENSGRIFLKGLGLAYYNAPFVFASMIVGAEGLVKMLQ